MYLKKYLNTLIFSLSLLILSSLLIVMLHFNNRDLIKVEKRINFTDINEENINKIISIIDEDFIGKFMLLYPKYSSSLIYLKTNNGSLIYQLFSTNNINERFHIVNKNYTSIVQNYLWKYMNKINKDTHVVFENVISKSNINVSNRSLDMVINIYGNNDKDIYKKLEEIIQLANNNLSNLIKDEINNTFKKTDNSIDMLINKMLFDIDTLNSYMQGIKSKISKHSDDKVVSDSDHVQDEIYRISNWHTGHRYDKFQQIENLKRAKLDLVYVKQKLSSIFDENNSNSFYIDLKKDEYTKLIKKKYSIFIYAIFLFAFSLIFPLFLKLIFTQINIFTRK